MRIAAFFALACVAACKAQETLPTPPLEQTPTPNSQVPVAPSDRCGDPAPFVRDLFTQYAEGQKPRAHDTIFDDDTLKLIKADADRAEGELPNLDYDPVCNCQDYEKLAVNEVLIESGKTTVAHVAFVNGGKVFSQDFELTCGATGWRVHDITVLPEARSLRASLAPTK